jgi:hypothetical protein
MTKIVRAKVQHHSFGASGECVAIVSFDYDISLKPALDAAYVLTNTIEQAWWENASVEMVGPAKLESGCRSTSVGDRIEIERDDGTTELYSVDYIGFSRILEV